MFRFLLRLFGISDFDTCKSCEILKQQLSFANEEKKELTKTLLDIIRPKVVEAAPIELNQIQQTSALFSRRRSALEQRDREDAKILKQAVHLGKPDFVTDQITTERLEQELGIENIS
jgi:hypothetical protein